MKIISVFKCFTSLILVFITGYQIANKLHSKYLWITAISDGQVFLLDTK